MHRKAAKLHCLYTDKGRRETDGSAVPTDPLRELLSKKGERTRAVAASMRLVQATTASMRLVQATKAPEGGPPGILVSPSEAVAVSATDGMCTKEKGDTGPLTATSHTGTSAASG